MVIKILLFSFLIILSVTLFREVKTNKNLKSELNEVKDSLTLSQHQQDALMRNILKLNHVVKEFSLDSNLLATNLNGDSFRLENLLDEPKIVLRVPESSCDCYTEFLKDINEYDSLKKQPELVILATFGKQIDFELFVENNNLKVPIYNVNATMFATSILEKFNQPYFFKMEKNKISNIFLIEKDAARLNDLYMNSLKN